MAKTTHVNKSEDDHTVSAPDLHHLLSSRTKNDTDVASERLIRLNSLYGKDAPRDHFTATSAPPKTSSAADACSLKLETYLTNRLSVESTDSEEAVKGSDDESLTDGRVVFQEDTEKKTDRIQNDSSDELYRRGKEVEAIINYTDLAFSNYFGSHFDKEVSIDMGLWPHAALNREEAEAMVEGLERAHGK